MTLHRVRGIVLGAAACLALAPACGRPKPPPPDPDGRPEQAQPLALDTDQADSLHRAKADLDDWYRIELPSNGQLEISIAGTTAGAPAEFFLAATDETGQTVLVRERAGGRDRFAISLPAGPGVVLLWVGSQPETTTAIGYQLRVGFTPEPKPEPPQRRRKATPKPATPRPEAAPPPPPPPKFEKLTAGVVETSKLKGEGQSLTVSAGSNRGVSTGIGGRLVEGGRVIGTFTVTEVYPKGCKVRINGSLSGAVTADTVAELDVPIEAAR